MHIYLVSMLPLALGTTLIVAGWLIARRASTVTAPHPVTLHDDPHAGRRRART